MAESSGVSGRYSFYILPFRINQSSMNGDSLEIVELRSEEVHNRQLQPTASLSEERIETLPPHYSLSAPTQFILRKHNEENARQIEQKLKRCAPFARVLSARGYTPDSAATLLCPRTLDTIPDISRKSTHWQTLAEATEHLFEKLKEGQSIRIIHDNTLSSIVAASILESTLNKLDIASLTKEKENVASNITISRGEGTPISYDAEWKHEHSLQLKGTHPERLALLMARYLDTLAEQQTGEALSWEQNIRLAALAHHPKIQSNGVEKMLTLYGSLAMNASPEDVPGLLAIQTGLIGPQQYTPLEINTQVRPFLQKAIDTGYGAEVVKLLSATDIREAKDSLALLCTVTNHPRLRLDSCHLDLTPLSESPTEADTELCLSEVTSRLEVQVRAFQATAPCTSPPLFLVKDLIVESIEQYEDHIRIALNDGAQKITGFCSLNFLNTEILPGMQLHIIGELVHHQLPYEEIGILIRTVEPTQIHNDTLPQQIQEIASIAPSYTPQFETVIAKTAEEITFYSKELAEKTSGILAFDIETTLDKPHKACVYTFTDWEAKKNYVFDAVRGRGTDGAPLFHDMSPLGAVLHSQTARELIIQNEHFERSVLAQEGLFPRGVIDTIKELKRLRPDIERRGLRDGLYWCCDFELSKDEQTSDWTKREDDGAIPPAQLAYAIGDTEKLAEYYVSLRALDERTAVPKTHRISDLMAGMVLEKRLLHDFISENCPEYFALRAKKDVLHGMISTRLEEGILPSASEWGIGNGRERRGKVEVDLFKKRFFTLCNDCVDRNVIDNTLNALLEQNVSKTQLKKTLSEEPWRAAGFPNDTSIDDFIAHISDLSHITSQPEIRLKYKTPTIDVRVDVNPSWNMSTYFKEYTRIYEQILTIKKDYPRIVDGELRLRKMKAQIGYLFSHHAAPPYNGRHGSARPRIARKVDIKKLREALHEKGDKTLGERQVEDTLLSLIQTEISPWKFHTLLQDTSFEDSLLYAAIERRKFLQAVSSPVASHRASYISPGKL